MNTFAEIGTKHIWLECDEAQNIDKMWDEIYNVTRKG